MPDFRKLIPQFDCFLAENNIAFEAVILGGAALQLLGLTDRVTKDCDVLSPKIPPEVAESSRKFADTHDLQPNWLNNGPESLIRDLPAGWEARTREIYRGSQLVFRTLGRLDLLRSKLFAFVDRGIDLEDILRIEPSQEEIHAVLPWLKERDGNPAWPEYVDIRMRELREALYGKDA